MLDRAIALAQRAAEGPPELVATVKATIATMATVDDHRLAVETELTPQVHSINQPHFAERLARLAARVSTPKR